MSSDEHILTLKKKSVNFNTLYKKVAHLGFEPRLQGA